VATDGEQILRLRRASLHWRDFDDEVIALEGRSGVYMATNPSGAVLWRALSDGATRPGLAAALVERFAIDPLRAQADVDAYLDLLRVRKLLEVGGPLD
jgi:hypothetical protein